MAQCPECGHKNRQGLLICENCGKDLYEGFLGMAATKKLDSGDQHPFVGDTNPSSNPIVLYIDSNEEPIAIPRTGQVILGRSDQKTPDVVPDIDLAPFNAQSFGVSRQHARINVGTHPPTVIDLNSFNGTFINGQRLLPEQPHQLKSSDEIRLGKMVIRFFYK